MNKKGLSTVVASVLIVMLTVVTVVAIAQFVVPFVKNSLNKGSECIPYRQYFKFDNSFEYNCKKDGISYILSVKAMGDKEIEGNVKGMKLVLYGDGTSVPLEINSKIAVNSIFGMVDGSDTLKVPKTGEVKSYIYNSTDSFNRAEVFTVLQSGRTCETKTDEIVIGAC